MNAASTPSPHKPRPGASSALTERDVALESLNAWASKGIYPDRMWETRDDVTAFVRELVWGCIRQKGRLDGWIDHLTQREPPPRLRPVLWLGLYQLLEMDHVAEHAAVHETIECAARAGVSKNARGFVNAILRRTQRERDTLIAWMSEQALPVRGSHPETLIHRWTSQLGEEECERICAWNNQRAQSIARLCDPDNDKDEIPGDLQAVDGFPVFYVLPRGFLPTRLPGFADGRWYLQDPSTSIAPQLLNAQAGETILDACAAPGGKTGILSDTMQRTGVLWAGEPHPRRRRRLQENIDRLKLQHVHVTDINLLDGPENLPRFDGILLDVPCSNTGVLQRRPDARWRFDPAALPALTQLQRDLLDAAARYVDPGGRIVYSTCSIDREEGPYLVAAWLSCHPDWELAREKLLLPGKEGTDGAYAARLNRR